MPHPELIQLAHDLERDADREDWDAVADSLNRFNQRLTLSRFSASDKTQLAEMLARVQAAIAHAKRRRDEIGNLVGKLSDTPL